MKETTNSRYTGWKGCRNNIHKYWKHLWKKSNSGKTCMSYQAFNCSAFKDELNMCTALQGLNISKDLNKLSFSNILSGIYSIIQIPDRNTISNNFVYLLQFLSKLEGSYQNMQYKATGMNFFWTLKNISNTIQNYF